MDESPHKSRTTLMKTPFYIQTPDGLDYIRSIKIQNAAKVSIADLATQRLVTVAKLCSFVMASEIFSLRKERVSVWQETYFQSCTLDSLGNHLDRIKMSLAETRK